MNRYQEAFESVLELIPNINTEHVLPVNSEPELLRMARIVVGLAGNRTVRILKDKQTISCLHGFQLGANGLYATDDRFGIVPGTVIEKLDGYQPKEYVTRYVPEAKIDVTERVIWSEIAASADELQLSDGRIIKLPTPQEIVVPPQICAEDLETALLYAGEPQSADEMTAFISAKSKSIKAFKRLVIDLRRSSNAAASSLEAIKPLLTSHATTILINEETAGEAELFARYAKEQKLSVLIGRETAGASEKLNERSCSLPDGLEILIAEMSPTVIPDYRLPFLPNEINGNLVITTSRCTCG